MENCIGKEIIFYDNRQMKVGEIVGVSKCNSIVTYHVKTECKGRMLMKYHVKDSDIVKKMEVNNG